MEYTEEIKNMKKLSRAFSILDSMKNSIIQFEKDFTTCLTEKEKMIFQYAYNKGQESLSEDKVEIFTVTVMQHQRDTIGKFARVISKSLKIECDVDYLNTTFPFYNHYQVTLEGKSSKVEEALKKFRKQFGAN